LVIGGDNKSVSALDQLQKAFRRLSGLQGRFARGGSDDEREKLQKQIEGAKTQCVGQYTEFVENMQSGRELDDVLKYDSVDVLTSAMQRLELLNAAGIFRANPPPFGDSKVRVHQLKSLTAEQQVMFVKLRLQAIFDRCKRAGATRSGTELRQVVFLDEGHKYFSKEPDDIINVIAKEARKFGLGLWCASQSPTEFPEAFLTNVGATALLGIHSRYWPDAQRMLRCSEDTLHYTKPKEVITVKFQREGQADPPWQNIIVPNPGNPAGVAAAGFR